ncbi:hypothetical protein RRG08_061579 [Elysia crispata]|uniref:Uncharacterized protein n=1 Tax=Elysia crispata TaxID=231223 RepID=A0AAE0YSN7_9GAST|nr:hypothetical protein RRG08_061579 [Elysia crispata]
MNRKYFIFIESTFCQGGRVAALLAQPESSITYIHVECIRCKASVPLLFISAGTIFLDDELHLVDSLLEFKGFLTIVARKFFGVASQEDQDINRPGARQEAGASVFNRP